MDRAIRRASPYILVGVALVWSAVWLWAIADAIREDDGSFTFIDVFVYAGIWLVPLGLGATLVWIIRQAR